jgi:hypothetical protein
MLHHSDSIAKLAPALVKAQAEVENATKNATNPHFKSQYADLAEIIRTVKPVFTVNGLAVLQVPGFEDGHATVESMLIHESGEWIAGVSGAPLQKADPQGVGSAITYLRRYSLAALAGIAQEDDDGNAATTQGNAVEYITEGQAADLRALIDEVGADLSRFLVYVQVSDIERIPKAKYAQAVKSLERKREENGAAKAKVAK